MSFSELQTSIREHLSLIKVDSTGLAESKERAAKFLVFQAILLEKLKEVDDDLAHLSTLRDASYAQSIGISEGKNITEKKINIGKDTQFNKVRQSYEEVESLRDYIKGHIKIFENAHILFRNLMKE